MNLVKAIRFGVLAGVLGSALVTLAMTAWDWLENPGGIFRGPGGTSWNIVLETALSWLLPTFAGVAVIALLGHLLVCWIRSLAAGRGSGKPKRDD